MGEDIVVVDEQDRHIGVLDKEKCHDGKGILHRAFQAMLFNEKGEVLMARRSKFKRLWPGFWDASVSSHIRPGESYVDAALRRIPQEIGVGVSSPRLAFTFRYQVPYQNEGSENEICGLVLCRLDGKPRPSKDEVSEIKFVSPSVLLSDKNSKEFSPWLKVSIDELVRRKVQLPF